MILSTILAVLSTVANNLPAAVALGVDVVDMFDKGKALVTSDTASTPAERAATLAEIAVLEAARDARLEELRLTAPNS